MNFTNVINLMNQQLKAVNEIEALIAYNEEQGAKHSVAQSDIDALRAYIRAIRTAANTAIALAKHYEKPDEKPEEEPLAATPTEPKKKAGKKSAPPKEEPSSEIDEFDFLM